MNEEKKQNRKTSLITGTIKIQLIKDFMKKKNLTRMEFAEMCKISVKDLRKVLDDYSDFEPIVLLRIARTMGLDFADLVK